MFTALAAALVTDPPPTPAGRCVAAVAPAFTRGRVLWSVSLSSNCATQNVVLPADALQPGSRVLLVAGGKNL